MKNEISNSDDCIDSRDVIARIEELESELETAYEEYADAAREANGSAMTKEQWLETDDFDDSELTALQALQEEAQGYAPDWTYGAQLIRSTYFVEYCQDLVQDIGDLPRDMPGYLVIDWEATARNLKADYTTVDFGDAKYYIR